MVYFALYSECFILNCGKTSATTLRGLLGEKTIDTVLCNLKSISSSTGRHVASYSMSHQERRVLET